MISIFLIWFAFIIQIIINFKNEKRLDVLENENTKLKNKINKVVRENGKNK